MTIQMPTASNFFFLPKLSGLVGSEIKRLSFYLNQECKAQVNFGQQTDNYERIILSVSEGVQISPAVDIFATNPKTGLNEYACDDRTCGKYQDGVDNCGLSGVAETVSSDLAPGSMEYKLQGLTGLLILSSLTLSYKDLIVCCWESTIFAFSISLVALGFN